MDVLGLLNDLVGRLQNVEGNNIPHIASMRREIEALNRQYEEMKKPKSFWLRFVVVMILWAISLSLVPFVFQNVLPKIPFIPQYEALFDMIFPTNVADFSDPEVIWGTLSAPFFILYIVLCIFLVPICNITRKRKAKNWWETVGKVKSVQLIQSIEAETHSMNNYLRENPLYEHIPEWWRTARDVARIGNLILTRKAFSLEEAFSLYDDILDREYERKQAQEERRRISAEIASLTNEIRENNRREERDKIARDAAIDSLLWELKNK